VLCDIEGFSYQEIAATLGVKLGTVRSRIHRGRAQLRSALEHRRPGPVTVGHGQGSSPASSPASSQAGALVRNPASGPVSNEKGPRRQRLSRLKRAGEP
jgi:Sigma-70, region 4